MNNIIKHDIKTEDDIAMLVHTFYGKVREDEILAPVFNAVIKDNWDHHLKIMCNFWSSILLYTRKYLSDPMQKHLPLPLEKKHFDKWLMLFEETVNELFIGKTATEAVKRANSIARLMKSMKEIPL